MKSLSGLSLLVLIMCGVAANAYADTIWDESLNGDLSNNGLQPTPLLLTAASNIVLGITGNAGQGVDRDYFSITIPEGLELASIMLLPSTSVSGGVSFIGIQAGPQLTVSTTGAGVENLIGLGHYGNDQIGSDLLPAIAVGFYHPLPAGVYSIWVQDTGGPASYGFDFATTPVPLPGAAGLLLTGLAGLFSLRRKPLSVAT